MKERILIFVVGLLVGTAISAGIFFAYVKGINTGSSNNQGMQMPSGNPPSMPGGQNRSNGQNSQGGQSGQPPEPPTNNNNN